MQKSFIPPKTITKGKDTYTYIETKNTNNKGQTLSEPCYWYSVNGKREPMTIGNIKAILR
jgi:hypothetical protein